MKLFCRSHQLAEYLCDQILEGHLTNPLPSTRQLATQLGVGVVTLQQAFRRLQQKGYVSIRSRRGVTIIHPKKKRSAKPSQKIVRLFFHGCDETHPDPCRWFTKLSQYLQHSQIQVSYGKIAKNRFCLSGEKVLDPQCNEVLLLAGILPERIQRSFVNSSKPVIMIGKPAVGISVPYVNYDMATAIRHSVHAFGRQGMSRITLLLPKTNTPSFQSACEAFRESCKQWAHDNIRARIIFLPVTQNAQVAAFHRLTAKYSPSKEGFILSNQCAPFFIHLMLAKGLKIPKDVDFRVLLSMPDIENIIPNIPHYPVPIDAMLKVIRKMILCYYETGKLPAIHYQCPLKAVEPRRRG